MCPPPLYRSQAFAVISVFDFGSIVFAIVVPVPMRVNAIAVAAIFLITFFNFIRPFCC